MIESFLKFIAVGALIVGIIAYICNVPRSTMPGYLAIGATIGALVYGILVLWVMSVFA